MPLPRSPRAPQLGQATIRLLSTILLGILLAAVPARAQGPTPTPPTPTPAPLNVTITGTVTSGTAGMNLPPGLPLTLHVLRPDPKSPGAQHDVRQIEAKTDAESKFRFEQVSAQTGDYVFISVPFEGIQQSSVIVELTPGQAERFELPLVLYGLTDDPSVITLISAQHILDFKRGDFMQVLAAHHYRNLGDRFYLTRTASGQPISVTVPLPIGAVGIAFDETGRFAVGGSEFAPVVQDSRPVRPGQVHEVIFSYQVPYAAGASIDQDYPYTTQTVEILIPDDAGVRLVGGPLPGMGGGATPRTASFTAAKNTALNPNRPYTQYVLSGGLKAGERLVYTLEGGGAATVAERASRGSDGPSFVAIAVLAITVVGAVALAAILLRGMTRRRK